MRHLDLSERDSVVFVRATAPAIPGQQCTDLALELVGLCADLDERLEPLRGIVFAADGNAFFVRSPASAADCDAIDGTWAEATAAVGRLQPPTIAALQHDAIGPAWELALACDLRLAAADAQVGSPEVRWGRMPRAGGTQRLARLVGEPKALELLLLGRSLSAAEAQAYGLVHRTGELNTTLDVLLGGLASSAPIALQFAKEAAHAGSELPLEAGLRLEADLAALLLTTTDRAEGIGAHLARREARFDGR